MSDNELENLFGKCNMSPVEFQNILVAWDFQQKKYDELEERHENLKANSSRIINYYVDKIVEVNRIIETSSPDIALNEINKLLNKEI